MREIVYKVSTVRRAPHYPLYQWELIKFMRMSHYAGGGGWVTLQIRKYSNSRLDSIKLSVLT